MQRIAANILNKLISLSVWSALGDLAADDVSASDNAQAFMFRVRGAYSCRPKLPVAANFLRAESCQSIPMMQALLVLPVAAHWPSATLVTIEISILGVDGLADTRLSRTVGCMVPCCLADALCVRCCCCCPCCHSCCMSIVGPNVGYLVSYCHVLFAN